MGRPINKKYLGDAVDSIKVSHSYNTFDGAETAGGEDTYIVSQRSTRKFLVADASDGWEEVLTLVDKDAGSLALGEFRISGVDADGAEYNVARLYNRTLRLGSADGSFVKEAWSVAPAAGAPTEAISAITQASPAVVTIGSTANMTTGETVTIAGVVGMVEVDGVYTVTVIDATTFSLDGIDSTGFTAYTSGGTVSGISEAGSGSIDLQVS